MNDYEKQANDFATKHGVKLSVIDSKFDFYFPGDKERRRIFKMKLQRGRKSYTFDFGQSIAAGNQKPTMYDVLSVLEKYEPESFENFCDWNGYDSDSRSAERTYKAVQKEYNAVERLFSDVMEELQEIQ